MPVTIDDVKDRATLTAPEAAELLNISLQATYPAVRAEHLPSIRLGRKVVIPTRPLLDLLGHGDEQQQPSNVRELQAVRS